MSYDSTSYNSHKKRFVTQNFSRDLIRFNLDIDDGCHDGRHWIILDGGPFWAILSSSNVTYGKLTRGRGMSVFSKDVDQTTVSVEIC